MIKENEQKAALKNVAGAKAAVAQAAAALAAAALVAEISLTSKPVSQSSTIQGAVASRAVDGNTGGEYKSNSCTHTGGGPTWWKVDLQAEMAVSSVKIFNRQDCCMDRLVGATVTVGALPCGAPVTSQAREIDIDCGSSPVHGSDVKIARSGLLTLCEVKIFGTNSG